MRKFTQGTWEVSEKFGGAVLVRDKAGQLLCDISDCMMYYGHEENMANMRLVAAAPELYALAEELANLPDEQCMISPLIHEARRLIARIDGEEAQA